MSKGQLSSSPKAFGLIIASWLVPGAGHFMLGQRGRGLILFVTITLVFWTGVIIGGARSTVDYQNNAAWFIAQVFAGGYSCITIMLGKLAGAAPSYGKTLDLATIYTGIAGLLNALVMLDVLARTESASKAGKAKGRS